MIKFDDEVKLKKELDSHSIRYDDTMTTCRFFVEFVDNKNYSVISHGVYKTPIGAVRQLNQILNTCKLPADDVDIVLRFAFSSDAENYVYKTLQYVLSPYLYYKQEQKVDLSSPQDTTKETTEENTK